ncbi:MAG TPA: ankyrin repeat domain-containing protein [Spirochaetota bacterium]|nr:ankyrin repeat domain-containing protein [Spirochaetota bacterium]
MSERDKLQKKSGAKDSIGERIKNDPGFALQFASENGDINLAKTTLEKGKIDVNYTDQYGFTPLFRAVMNKQKEFISFLLDNGADPDIQTREGFTALMAAAESGDNETLKILLYHKANPNLRTIQGTTSLHIAASSGHPETINLLLKSGADASIRDNTDIKKVLEQQTGHEIFMTSGDEKMLKGLTALDVARMCGHTKAEEILSKVKQ